MEAAVVGGLIKVILPKLLSIVDGRYKRLKGVKSDIRFLARELLMIMGAIDDELSLQIEDNRAVPRLWIEELRELAHGIEDCIDSLLYSAAWKQQSWVQRSVRSFKTLRSHLQLAGEMQKLKSSAVEAYQRKQRYTVQGQLPSSDARMDQPLWPSVSDPRILDTDLVGIDGPRAELMDQLAEAEGKPKQLKVVAIVGFCGLGKSALAAHVYNSETGDGRFDKHAWVCAAHKGPADVLADILRKLGADADSSCQETSEIGQICVDLRKHLQNKRYFIVIDDIQTKGQWDTIKSAFPTNNNIASRVVVTTTIQSVADACSSDNGYVHKMSRLDENFSKQLFSKKACPDRYLHYEQPDSEAILKKCDGLPLALVIIGEFFKTKDWPIGHSCEDACSQLRDNMEKDETLEAMRRVLIRKYTNLPGHALKACLLYFGMFPSDYPIRRKSLLRRWLAEGFVGSAPLNSTPDRDPAGAFSDLMNHNIIEPISISNNENVKACQTHGMMREVILQMSVSQNFFTLISDGTIEPKYARRLSLHQSKATNVDNLGTIDFSLIRSLIIFGKASEAILDFSKYQLLRVLDLEKCDDLNDGHLKNICSLLLLKYLSLGGNVTHLPSDIGKLKDLEALDLRRCKVNIVPIEVFQLPCLIHIFGKFKLPDKVKPKCEVLDFLSTGKSNLQTLAGFVTDGGQGFLRLMGHMKKLRKLKIWCESSGSADNTNWTDLQEAIQQFIQDENGNTSDRSLSLHFHKCSEDFLYFLNAPCHLSSLKLHGKLHALPQFLFSLLGLKELCLSSTNKLMTTGLLEALSKLSYLKYLKLVARELEEFVIKDKAFPRLRRLCFVLQCPSFPTIQEGSVPFLASLQLHCKDLDGLSGIKIEHLDHLKEIILDHRVTQDAKWKWEKAAKEHPNRPKIFLVKMTGIEESDPTFDCISLEAVPFESAANSEEINQSVHDNGTCNQELETSVASKKLNSSTVQLESTNNLEILPEVHPLTVLSKIADTAESLVGESPALELTNIQGLECSVTLKKHICSIDDLYSSFNNKGISEVPPSIKLSETARTAESEPTDEFMALQRVKIGPSENSAAQTGTQVQVYQRLESSPTLNKKNSCNDNTNSSFKSIVVPEISLSAELSIAGNSTMP